MATEIDFFDNRETVALHKMLELIDSSVKIDIAVAFLSLRGWNSISNSIRNFVKSANHKLRIIVRRDAEQTSPISVEEIFRLPNTEIRFHPNPNFHPKRINFHTDGKITIMTGSANITEPGLSTNSEDGSILTIPIDSEEAEKAKRIFENWWNESPPLSREDVEKYKKEAAVAINQVKGKMARIRTPDVLRKKGVGYVVEQRGNQVKLEFYPTIFSKPPYTTESKIALINDVEILKPPLERLKNLEFDEPWRFDLKQKAAHLKIENRGGQLSNSRTDLLPHQIFTAYKVVSSPTKRFLLADEVGLGKTIEAGLIFYALRQRGDAERTLIITPAGLARQWQEEMEDKFGIIFLVLKEDFLDKNPRIWDIHNLAIASIDTLKRENHKKGLLECQKWQLIVFDEAHKLSAKAFGDKIERTQNYKLALDLKDHTDNLLLLTAITALNTLKQAKLGMDEQRRMLEMILELVDLPETEKNHLRSAYRYRS